MQKNIGIIGCGQIGGACAARLLECGHRVYVRDIRPEAILPLMGRGAIAVEDISDLVAACRVIILALFHEADIEAAAGEILSAGLRDRYILDTSTTSLEQARRNALLFRESGNHYLDTPLTGGAAGIRNHTLSIMAGGDADAFDACREILEEIGGNVVYIGRSGSGQIAKLINQMLMCAISVSIAEAFGLADKTGVDIGRVFAAIEHGGCESKLLSSIGPLYSGSMPLPDPDDPGGGLHYSLCFKKDLSYALKAALDYDVYLPVTSTVLEVIKQTLATNRGSGGDRRIFELWKELLNRRQGTADEE